MATQVRRRVRAQSASNWLRISALALPLSLGHAFADGFKALSSNGMCTVQSPGEDAAEKLALDHEYSYGSTLKTQRNSTAVLEFSNGNRFRVLPRTVVTVTLDVRNKKVRRIQLAEGKVALELDNLREGDRITVETPTAVCGAVGTHFEAAYIETEKKGGGFLGGLFGRKRLEGENAFSCSKGEIFAESPTFDVTSLKQGTALRATVHAGRENSHTEMSLEGGSVSVAFGGSNTLVVDAGTTLRTAHEKTDAAPFVAVQLETGTARSGDVDVSGKGSEFVLEGKDIRREVLGIGKYVAAAGKEGALQTELDREKAKPAPDPKRVAALEKEVAKAAKRATELRQLTSRNMRRLIRNIRRGVMRPPVRRP